METAFANKHPIVHLIFKSVVKLNPFTLWRNPPIFITEIGAFITLIDALFIKDTLHNFDIAITIVLWLTALFANYAEASAEKKNQNQASFLKSSRKEIRANRLNPDQSLSDVSAAELKRGDVIIVKEGELIPADGKILKGIASVDESLVTGESTSVIKGVGTDHDSVMAGTKLSSDQLTIQISSDPGENYLDKMIKLIEGVKRKKTPNEVALTILFSGLSFIFLFLVLSFECFGFFYNLTLPFPVLVAFLVCLIPTTISGLLSAIGIAGINRLMKKNVLALTSAAVEVAGDVNTVVFDKTGTITTGHRIAVDLIPVTPEVSAEFYLACYLTSFKDDTCEGRSILTFPQVILAKPSDEEASSYSFVPFQAQTRKSGAVKDSNEFWKGALDAIELHTGATVSDKIKEIILKISLAGGSLLAVANRSQILGLIHLKDTIKEGISEKFSIFSKLGITTIMVTGDIEISARSVAKEVGLDHFFAEATPESKLDYVSLLQDKGNVIAMTGDGVNDAPGLAQADLGLAMNSGTHAAKEAANMIDLDSQPTKLFEIIEIGKQILMTRGALTTFSITNDIAKYFAILPAILTPFFPFFQKFNILHLKTVESAVLSAAIFNALIILLLIPIAYKGAPFKAQSISKIFKQNILYYGLGGLVAPFVGIKLIDMILL